MIVWSRDWPRGPMPCDAPQALVWVGDPATIPLSALQPTETDLSEADRRPLATRPGFLMRRLLARRFVATLTDQPVEAVAIAAPAGRPLLPPPLEGLSLSSSNRGAWLAFALATSPVGIDIECVEPRHEPAWTMLAPSERVRLRGLDPALRWSHFLALWTLKEAYLKAVGHGLAIEPCDIAVADHERSPSLHVRGRDDIVLAIASRTDTLASTSIRVGCVVLQAPGTKP